MYATLTSSIPTLPRTLALALALATTGLVGCGDDDETPAPDAGGMADAGSDDAGADDAGPSDAGADAGDPDAGAASPLEAARDGARDAVGEAGLALASIPETERGLAEFLELEMTFVRLDAVIGEKIPSLIDLLGVIGEKRLRPASLPPNAVPALIIARQLARASRDIDAQLARTDWETSTDSDLAALATRLAAASTALQSLSDMMWQRYREIVDSVDTTSFPEEVEYVDDRYFQLLPAGAHVHAIVEGADVTSAFAGVYVDCTEQPFQIRVVDEERGTELLPLTTETMFNNWEYPVPAETPSSVRIELTNPVVGGNWPMCSVQVMGHRHWRGAQIEIDSGEDTSLRSLRSDWTDAAATLVTELSRLDTAGSTEERAIAEKVQAYLAELYATTGVWRGGLSSWYEDDYEIYEMTLMRVLDPMGDSLASSAHLAPTAFDGLRDALATIRSIEEQARQLLAPGHMTSS